MCAFSFFSSVSRCPCGWRSWDKRKKDRKRRGWSVTEKAQKGLIGALPPRKTRCETVGRTLMDRFGRRGDRWKETRGLGQSPWGYRERPRDRDWKQSQIAVGRIGNRVCWVRSQSSKRSNRGSRQKKLPKKTLSSKIRSER